MINSGHIFAKSYSNFLIPVRAIRLREIWPSVVCCDALAIARITGFERELYRVTLNGEIPVRVTKNANH